MGSSQVLNSQKLLKISYNFFIVLGSSAAFKLTIIIKKPPPVYAGYQPKMLSLDKQIPHANSNVTCSPRTREVVLNISHLSKKTQRKEAMLKLRGGKTAEFSSTTSNFALCAIIFAVMLVSVVCSGLVGKPGMFEHRRL